MGNDIRRLRYFHGLFLTEDEFNLEQNYHMRMRRFHNRWLHNYGIVYGLRVAKKPNAGPRDITITKGMALNQVTENDEEVSKEIILTDETTDYTLSGTYTPTPTTPQYAIVYIMYPKPEEKAPKDADDTEQIHWSEKPVIGDVLDGTNIDVKEKIRLAKVKLVKQMDGTIAVDSNIDMSDQIRTYAGFSSKALETQKITLGIEGVDSNLASIEGEIIDSQNGVRVNSPKTSFTGDLSVGGALSGSLNPNNISGTVPESKIDAAIARDSEVQARFDTTSGHSHNGIDSKKIPSIDSTYFANLSGANLTNLNPNNISGTVPESKIDAAIARDSEVQARFDTTSGHSHNGMDSKKIPSIDSTYFANLSGANLTNLNPNNISGTVPESKIDAAIARDSEVQARFDTISGHDHNDVNSKKILPSNLSGVTANVTAPNLNSLTGGSTSNASSLHYHATIPKQISKYHVPLKPFTPTGGDGFKIRWTGVIAELNKNVAGYIPLYLPHGAKLTKISVHTTTTQPSFYCYVYIWRASHETSDRNYLDVGGITVTSSGERQQAINPHTVDNNIGYYLLYLYVPPRPADITIDGIYIEYELDRLF